MIAYARFLFVPVVLLTVGASAGALPWWDDYPRIVQGDANHLKPYHADVVFGGGLNAPTWGIWGQVLFNRPKAATEIHDAGGRMLSYFETFGQSYCVIVSIPDDQLNTDRPRPSATHWSWQNFDGDPIYWAGAHSWFDDLPEARPYTRTHPAYGGPPMRYPDGRVATGYDGDPSDPMNHRVFDAGCSKNVLGEISFETHDANPVVQEKGPHEGLLRFDGVYAGVALMQKDSACPHWLDLDEAAVRYAAGRGSDGMWSDNYSPWDSFNRRPVERGFGDWSVALFRDYLKQHFDTAALTAMGVADVDRFDVRAALRAQVRQWGGDDTNLRDPKWRDKRWLNDDLWHAYVIFKRQQGTKALDAYDRRMHAAARAAGKPEFLIAGNDIPGLSLGWVRGGLDLVSTESSAGYSLDGGPRGLMLPPVGRHSARYRLAGVHARSRLVNVWPYLDGDLEKYRRNPELTRVMAYEMLAAGALPMPHPGLPRVLGDEQAYSEFFQFVGTARASFGKRVPHARTGLYYSSSSLLAFMTPGGFFDFGARPHQYGYYGWATALHDLHEPYEPVPEWQLTAESLAGLDLLIVPNATAIARRDIETVLRPWVDGGGRILVTGDSGARAGEAGNFALDGRGPLAEQIAHDGIYAVADNMGMAYYNEHESRAERRPVLEAHLNQARGPETPRLVRGTDAPATVGITPYLDPAREAFFIDLNNLAIDLEEDAVTATDPLTLQVQLPAFLSDTTLEHTVLSPESGVTATVERVGTDAVTITVSSFRYYASVRISPRDGA